MIIAIIVCGAFLFFNLPTIINPDPHWHGNVYRSDPDE